MSTTHDGFAGMATGNITYPTIFRLKPWIIAIYLIMGCLWIGLLIAYGWFLIPRAAHDVQHGMPPDSAIFQGLFNCAVGMPVGIWLMIMPFGYRLILNRNLIEETCLFMPLRLARTEIEGKRVYATAKHLAVVLYPTDRNRRPMQIWTGQYLNAKSIEDWVAAIPNIAAPHKEWRFFARILNYALCAFFGIPLFYALMMLLLVRLGPWRHA